MRKAYNEPRLDVLRLQVQEELTTTLESANVDWDGMEETDIWNP